MTTDFVLVVGMHRSGTSCLTGCLEDMGLNLGHVSTQNKFNAKGNKEDKRIFRLNESVLNYSNGAWNKIPQKLKWSDEQIKEQRDILEHYSKLSKPIGVKDPRMLITFPFWKSVLPSNIKFLGSFRNPHSVAKSLASRGKNLKVEISDGYELWYSYNKRLYKLYKEYDFKLINFDWEESKYLASVRQAGKDFELPFYDKNIDFFDCNLINQSTETSEDNIKIPWKCKMLYKKLKKIAKK